MDEAERLLMYFGHKSEAIATTLIMAINGAFFTIRGAGVTPTPSQIEQAKLNVAKARYVYVDGINELLGELADKASSDGGKINPLTLEFTARHLISISTDLTLQANKALSSGHQNKAAALLGNQAHGAMGQLLQRQLMHVELSAQDLTGQRHREPSSVVRGVVQQLAHSMLKGEDRV